MNSRSIIRDLNKYSTNPMQLSVAVIYSYARLANINCNHSEVLQKYISSNSELCEQVYLHFLHAGISIPFSLIVELLEMLISVDNRKEKGVVYTPELIKDFILEECIKHNDIPAVIDPACGCGSFLVSVAEKLHSKYGISYSECISKYIYGVDIDADAIEKTKLLLSLAAVANGENIPLHFNLLQADMLDPKSLAAVKALRLKGFDCVVGNPPYVRAKNVSAEEKAFFPCWKSSSIGNVDLYMPFFEIGLNLLRPNGSLGYITANGFLQGVNGRNLRKYLLSQGHPIKIIDFRDAQIFKNVTSYTCLTFVDKSKRNEVISYTRIAEENSLSKHIFSEYEFYQFEDGKPWRMRQSSVDSVIAKLENTGEPLSHWKIRNGLATLKNDLYFFTPTKEDETYYYRSYNGKEYPVEKDICIPIVKPNIIKNEQDLNGKTEIAIFPYSRNGSTFSIIEETTFMSRYPLAYSLLREYKPELDARDKGHGHYPAWYAYGRTQGMDNFGKKLLIPYISDTPTAVLSTNENLLFYCGYALFSDSEDELRILKAFLESDAFWFYIFHTSKPYAKGFMAFAKNYIVNFCIPYLSDFEIQYILSDPPHKELNEFIWKKYDIEVSTLSKY